MKNRSRKQGLIASGCSCASSVPLSMSVKRKVTVAGGGCSSKLFQCRSSFIYAGLSVQGRESSQCLFEMLVRSVFVSGALTRGEDQTHLVSSIGDIPSVAECLIAAKGLLELRNCLFQFLLPGIRKPECKMTAGD